MTGRQSREDEGAEQTALIVAAMKAARVAKRWSARVFAEEMAKAGVAWNADVVVNLEHGRRKSLRVHEAIAAAYVLDMAHPLDLLVPPESVNKANIYPVTPLIEADPEAVRLWISGQLGVPLRWGLESFQPMWAEAGGFDKIRAEIREKVERGEMTEPQAELVRDMVETVLSTFLVALPSMTAQEGGSDEQD